MKLSLLNQILSTFVELISEITGLNFDEDFCFRHHLNDCLHDFDLQLQVELLDFSLDRLMMSQAEIVFETF